MKKLDTCPFCGGEADYVDRWSKNGKSWFVYIECSICGTKTKPQFVNDVDDLAQSEFDEKAMNMRDRVADFWNRRVGA